MFYTAKSPQLASTGMLLAALLFTPLFSVSAEAPKIASGVGETVTVAQAQQWIGEMKEDERGPFERIRWFCSDGVVLPPTGAGCRGHGQGVQHGEPSARTQALRAAGYPIATVYAALTDQDLSRIAATPQELGAMLLERYLILTDDGWVFRRARYYRGAFQAEDESAVAERLLLRLLSEPKMIERHFLLLREAARLLPVERNSTLLSEARSEATRIAARDPAFLSLRNKIHSLPEPTDAGRVRAYAYESPRSENRPALTALSQKLERVFVNPDVTNEGLQLLGQISSLPFREKLQESLQGLNTQTATIDSFWRLCDMLFYIREHLTDGTTPALRRQLLSFSLDLERVLLQQWSGLEKSRAYVSRAEHLQFLLPVVQAAYGTGVLSGRTYRAAAAAINELSRTGRPMLGAYYQELRYLGRVPGWAAGEIDWEFGEGLQLMRAIEPRVDGFPGDRLHSGLLLPFSHELAALMSDAARLAGMSHQIMGMTLHVDAQGLNPGIARGILSVHQSGTNDPDAKSKIVLVQDTEATLPAVAGILTLREGNSLSHVQLLARNLGVPNAVIGESVINTLQSWIGREIVLAVSAAGRVQITPYSPEWDAVFAGKAKSAAQQIRPDFKRLDLSEKKLLPLNELSSRDSGRTVGPKAARLGELKRIFPEYITNGVALPFGTFASVLKQKDTSGNTLFDWIKARYAELALLASQDPQRYHSRLREVLAAIRGNIQGVVFSQSFASRLYEALQTNVGDPNRIGVFVRSDTNVEDLADFTGAGLNLTVPNVVGFGNILNAIRAVWASPFEERAFSWRQSRMTDPEQVYASVLLLRSVPVDKSGVIITTDLFTGISDRFTVAVNEGAMGGVSSQQAEVILVDRKSGELRLISEATAPTKNVVDPNGGVRQERIAIKQRILTPQELVELNRLVARVEKEFPEFADAAGQRIPADIEFGFVRGKLALFQIRPFLESAEARKSRYLLQLDAELRARSALPIDLAAPLLH